MRPAISELAIARWLMNAPVRDDLESREVFDPASLDRGPGPVPTVGAPMLVSDALETEGADDTSVVGWGLAPRAPWEVLP